MKKPIISFITINYNSSKYTIKLIESIEKYTSLSYEIIIVDNKSKTEDITNLELFTKNNNNIRLIKNSQNEGFASGNMLGSKYASGNYLLFINNDTELLNDATKFMYEYLKEHKDIALATGKIFDQHNNTHSSYKLFPSVLKELFGNSVARKYSKYNFPSNKIKLFRPTLVEVVSGSCMFFRADDFFKINGFDTTFFLYCEEEDISKRVWLSGKKVVFLPDAHIFHASGGSSKKSFEMEREYYISYNILLDKHFKLFSKIVLKTLLFFKLFRRSFKRENGLRLFLCYLRQGCNKSLSLRYG